MFNMFKILLSKLTLCGQSFSRTMNVCCMPCTQMMELCLNF